MADLYVVMGVAVANPDKAEVCAVRHRRFTAAGLDGLHHGLGAWRAGAKPALMGGDIGSPAQNVGFALLDR